MTGSEPHTRPIGRRSGPRRRPALGFSFIELVVVMGAMAMLMGLAVGYLSQVGEGTKLAQAKAMLSETAFRCIGASNGGRRAVFTLRQALDEDGNLALKVGASVAGPVLTHHFESLEFASEARVPEIHGAVELKRGGGHIGNWAHFNGGYMEFRPLSVFAMTEGLDFDLWIRPEGGNTVMSLVRGGESYEVLIVQRGDTDAYDVRLSLKVRKISTQRRDAPLPITFETKTGPVVADGRWTHVQVGYDGLDATIRINGLEMLESADPTARPGGAVGPERIEQVNRIVVPLNGLVGLTISSGERPYSGGMDSFRMRGVFRSEELERKLPGALEVMYPQIPLRIVYANGMLDPDVHNGDQILRIKDLGNPEDAPLRLTLGMYGTVAAFWETPGSAGPDSSNPRSGNPRSGNPRLRDRTAAPGGEAKGSTGGGK